MNILKILYDPLFNQVEQSGVSERQICSQTGISRTTINRLRVSTLKELDDNSIPSFKFYNAHIKTLAMLSIYLNCSLDSLIFVVDPSRPNRLTTLSDARKNYHKIIRYSYTTNRY